MTNTVTPTLAPILGRFVGGVRRFFWRRWPERCTGAKIAWIAYAAIATFLISWDASETGDHLGNTLMVVWFCFPSYLIAALVSSFMTMRDPSPVFVWGLTITLNGWFVFRLFCRFRKRGIQTPVPLPGPTSLADTPRAKRAILSANQFNVGSP